MLSNLIVALEAVVPVFVLIGIGMAVRKAGIVNETENKHFNRLVFLVFFPTLMFQNLYGTDIREAANPRLIGFGVVYRPYSGVILCSWEFPWLPTYAVTEILRPRP